MTGKGSLKVAPEKTGRAGEKVPEQTQWGEGRASQADTEQPKQRQLEQRLFSAGISSREGLGCSVRGSFSLCRYQELRSGLGRLFRPQSGEQIARKQTDGGILVKAVTMVKKSAEESWSQNIPGRKDTGW